jgi:hypothetical protein
VRAREAEPSAQNTREAQREQEVLDAGCVGSDVLETESDDEEGERDDEEKANDGDDQAKENDEAGNVCAQATENDEAENVCVRATGNDDDDVGHTTATVGFCSADTENEDASRESDCEYGCERAEHSEKENGADEWDSEAVAQRRDCIRDEQEEEEEGQEEEVAILEEDETQKAAAVEEHSVLQ